MHSYYVFCKDLAFKQQNVAENAHKCLEIKHILGYSGGSRTILGKFGTLKLMKVALFCMLFGQPWEKYLR